MKQFFKKLMVTVAVLLAAFSIVNLAASTAAYADGYTGRTGDACGNFLGLISWDCDVVINDQDSLVNSIAQIATNIFTDISVVAAYLVLGYVIYGGYLYMFSSGDPGKVASSKKTLIHAFIGLAIVMLSNVILNGIRVAFIRDCSLADANSCTDPGTIVLNAANWFIGISGVVSAVFIIVGGVGYVTSAGDPGKLQKAKTTLLYALIGLIIVGLSATITAFVSSTIRNAGTPSDADSTSYQQNLIAKEFSHEN